MLENGTECELFRSDGYYRLILKRRHTIMKKIYEIPAAEMTRLTKASFLEVSGDVTAVDNFDDDYGASFENA